MNVLVIGGCGAMGRAVVRDLVENHDVFQVVIGDIDTSKGEDFVREVNSKKLSYYSVDIDRDDLLFETMKGLDVVVNASWYEHNLAVMRAALQGGVHYVDLGGLYHLTKEQLKLNKDFAEAGLTAILGMGASPGITNVLAAFASQSFDEIHEIHIRTGSKGGAGFAYSAKTILDELTMNPIIYENGTFREVKPLSGRERYRLPDPVGEVEGFFSIHSELATLPFTIKGVRTVTFRVAFSPALVEKVQTLLNLGLGSQEPILIKGVEMAPREFLDYFLTSKPVLGYVEEYKSLQVEVVGIKENRPCTSVYETVVNSSKELNLKGSAIWTGFPASVVALMIGRGAIKKRGVFAPETAVDPRGFLDELEGRGIVFTEKVTQG